MKIATQNLILIAPIFLVLAVITAVVLFVSERREVRWGLDSEAQGVALTIAEFTRASTLAALPGETPKDREARLRPPIDRVLKFGHARRVELFVMEAGQPRRILDIGERAGTPPSIDADTLDRVIDGAVPVDHAPGATIVRPLTRRSVPARRSTASSSSRPAWCRSSSIAMRLFSAPPRLPWGCSASGASCR